MPPAGGSFCIPHRISDSWRPCRTTSNTGVVSGVGIGERITVLCWHVSTDAPLSALTPRPGRLRAAGIGEADTIGKATPRR